MNDLGHKSRAAHAAHPGGAQIAVMPLNLRAEGAHECGSQFAEIATECPLVEPGRFAS
jgi:hypothetical protein